VSGGLTIDISAAVNQGAGIGRYAREMTRHMIPLLNTETSRLWYAEEEPAYDPGLPKRSPWNTLPVRKSPLSRTNVDRLFVRQSLPFTRLLRLGHPSDVYSPDFTAPSPGSARSHITVHDLAWLHEEAATPKPLADFLGPVVERAVQSATTVFAVSDAIRTEIIDVYGIPESQVIVAPNASTEHFREAEPLSDERLVTFGLRSPFLLSVGTIEPRKNLTTLFEALTQIPADVQLAIVGRSGWNAAEILGRIGELGLSGRVVRLGFVPDEVLPKLMSAASAVVYPSRYEGFGLPVIEALSIGIPVVASDIPVFREVGGEEVEYFDPENATALAEAIDRAISSNGGQVARRRRREQAGRFSWQRSAEIVVARLKAST
jgi:glycosyltransferase involved in cell wall biosynthesis